MVHKIVINGKEVNIRFGLHLQEMLFASHKAGDLLGTLKFSTVIIYYGHENWALGADQAGVVSKSDVFNWIEEIYGGTGTDADAAALKSVMDAYSESAISKRINDANEASEAAKKKLAGETSEATPPVLSGSLTESTINLLSSNITNY